MTQPRLATGFWISAKLRLIRDAGGYAAILNKGDETAGAMIFVLRMRDGRLSVAAPAPQSEMTDGGDRRFEWRLRDADEAALEALLARERKFDSDLWIVEVECAAADFERILGLDDASGRG